MKPEKGGTEKTLFCVSATFSNKTVFIEKLIVDKLLANLMS
jgi:hypothetical protein